MSKHRHGAQGALFNDVHTHLFNLSDLPAEGFLRYAVLPREAPDLPNVFQALADWITRLLKWKSVTARRETSQFQPRRPYRDPQHFAKASAEHIAKHAIDAAKSDMARSYVALRNLLVPSADGLRKTAGPPRKVMADLIASWIEDPDAMAATLHGDDGKLIATRMQACGGHNEAPVSKALQFERIMRVVKWAFELSETRCRHARSYVEAINKGASAVPRRIVNLLVDLDQWVDDAPSPGSSMIDQIEFWQALRSDPDRSKSLDIQTFAGLDPLKEAECVELGVGTSTLNWLKQVCDATNACPIAGVKMYPAMGFKPIGNIQFAAQDFVGRGGVGARIVDRWGAEKAGRIGEALDRALLDFYGFCDSRNLPILAHADAGNAPGESFGERANPANWLPVLQGDAFPNLRICLAHFADARLFVEAMETIDECDLWALNGTRDLLQLNIERPGTVFVDVGYTAALFSPLSGPDFPRRFFEALGRYYDWVGERTSEAFVFGSDWIMVGQEDKHDAYLVATLKGMDQAEWPQIWQDRFLESNFERFLNGGGGEAGRSD